jgi:hypothetical protein
VGGVAVNAFDLYELCVQSPAIESAFLRAVHGGGAGLVLGEDFCGPAGIGRWWVVSDDTARAVVADRDAAPLRHAARRLSDEMPGALERFTVRERDVLEVGDRADVIAALNFAACELRSRERLVTYLRHALYRLNAGGVFVADLYAGDDAMSVGVSSQTVGTEAGEVEYIWEQRGADVCTGRVVNAIHFRVAGGDEIRDAFVYDWRLWGVAELREAMREAGFRSTEVHAGYGDAMDGDGNLLLGAPISSDAPGASVDADGAPEADEPAVYLIVGRV